MMRDCPLGSPTECHGHYKRGQFGIWSPESFTHPAKMSPDLAFRILSHLEELGLLRRGMTILDPMCGVGTTLLTAAIRGYRTVGIEIEGKFVSMARANAERLKNRGFEAPIEIIQGDARDPTRLLAHCDCAITSPPYLTG